VPQADTTADTIGAAASGAETFFRYGLIDLGHTREELQAKLGAPDSVSSRPFQNRHDKTQTDSVLTIHYPGLAAEIYRVSANGKELTVSVRVSDNRYIEPTAPVRIGMSQADVRTLMGAADDSSGGVLSYACATCTALGNERIEVRLSGSRVAAVTVFHSID
jgi:hypothetical protein